MDLSGLTSFPGWKATGDGSSALWRNPTNAAAAAAPATG